MAHLRRAGAFPLVCELVRVARIINNAATVGDVFGPAADQSELVEPAFADAKVIGGFGRVEFPE
jgi:hypothetical protein